MSKEVRQRLFDISLNHIRKQGKPSVRLTADTQGTYCEYRGSDGCGCAAAPFILEYKVGMEGSRFSGLVAFYADSLDETAVANNSFVDRLQTQHDDVARMVAPELFMRVYEERMSLLADAYDLEYSAP